MSGLDIASFLPAYSGIMTETGDPLYSFYSSSMPQGYTKEFPISTFLKREFNSLKLPAREPPRKIGTPFKPLGNQSFVARFLSTYTPYDRLLVFHAVGTGKTCLFSLLSEAVQDQNPNMLPTLVLTRSEVLQANAKNEIAETCTNGKYIPSRWDPKLKKMISDDAYLKRFNKLISQRYTFDTWERISKELASQSKEYIKEVYSNRVIVIDEAHGLRIQPRESKINIYNEIYCLLHTVENCKIILLTATPMRDQPEEIASLMNLLLPEDQSFDKDNFREEYFKDGVFKEDKRAEFKAKIRGLVSYVRQTNSGVRRTYEGIVVPTYLGKQGIKMTPLEIATMEKMQSEAYERAYQIDRRQVPDESAEENDEEDEESGAGLYKNSRQASLFVAPDGSYGAALEGKWLKLSKEQEEQRALAKLRAAMSPEEREKDKIARATALRVAKRAEKKAAEAEAKKSNEEKSGKVQSKKVQRPLRDRLSSASKDLRAAIFGGTKDPGTETKLRNLARMSSKYAGIIRQLIMNPTEKAFVYCNLVAGSGCNLFAALLELFDFEHAPMPISTGAKPNMEDYKGGRRKFILITSKFPTNAQASYLVNKVYNDPVNKYGDYIQVIVASRIVSEGISFKATRQFHGATPGWNATEFAQAEGRTDRTSAYLGLPPIEQFIKLYYWCSMPQNKKAPSIDFEMYQRSEDKDFLIKQIERLLKEAAVDCALNVARNMRPGEDRDGSRQCDYSTCVYKCDGIPEGWYALGGTGPDKSLIDDTYNLYYARDMIDEIKNRIQSLFRNRFMYDFHELQPIFQTAPPLVLLRALKEMIDQSTPIFNKYGIRSYLRENSNLYFLVDNHEVRTTNNMYLLARYNAAPVLRDNLSFHEYARIFEYNNLGEKLDTLAALSESEPIAILIDQITLTIRNLDPKSQESILESFVRASRDKIDHNVPLREAILQIYQSLIQKPTGGLISPILQETYKILRCYDEKSNEWSDCTEKQVEKFAKTLAKRKAKLRANPFGYYGIFDRKKDKFKIVTVIDAGIAASTGKPDKRKDRAGNVCGTGKFIKGKMVKFMLDMGDIADENELPSPDIRSLLNEDEKGIMDRQATSSNVYKLWFDKIYSMKSVNPTRVDIEEAEQEMEELEEKAKERPLNKTDTKTLKKLIEDIKNEKQLLRDMRKRVDEFSKDKLERWYSILAFGKDAYKMLCPALQTWFKELGYFEEH
jgi:Type III restriction enzyme, res subunit